MCKIRDPLYGFIECNAVERDVINSPAFQRLRRVRQLALANYVYPSANHTRFEHCIGTMHVAGIMARRFRLDEDAVRVVRLAALVHDIGHGPFGHVTEEVFRALNKNPRDETSAYKFHEEITARIIRSRIYMGRYLGDDADKIANILDPDNDIPSIEKDIVSGPLDADKIDYLRRDSYFCGVEYGVFDYHKLLDVLTAKQAGAIKELRIQPDGVHCVEQFVVAKYFINYQVYRHRIRLITDAMLVRAVVLAFEENEYVKALYNYDASSESYLDIYLDADDTRLLDEGANNPSEGQPLFRMLRDRNLLKRIFHCNASELLADEKNMDKAFIKKQLDKYCKTIESEIAEMLKMQVFHCILKVYPIRFDRKKEDDVGKVMVLQLHGEPLPLDECTEIYKPTEAKLRQMNIDVYAPLRNGNAYTPDELSKIRGYVMEILKGYLQNGGSKNVAA